MDKLKENIFGISLGVVGVFLLVLSYFLVYSPLSELGAKEAQVQKAIADYKKFSDPAKYKYVPTKDYKERLDQQKESDEADLKSGVAFYDEQSKLFHEYFDGSTEPPVTDIFVQKYNDSIKGLVDGYRLKFHIKVDPGQEDQAPPVVKKVEAITEENKMIPVAMKEYWIVKEVFDVLTKAQVGGLRSIDFPGRAVESKDAPKYYRALNAVVQVEMPFSRIENVLTELFQSKRVPFQLEELTYQKTLESLGQFQSPEKSLSFKNENDAKAAEYSALVPEPAVLVTLKLSAFDWQGGILDEKTETPKAEAEETGNEKPPRKSK